MIDPYETAVFDRRETDALVRELDAQVHGAPIYLGIDLGTGGARCLAADGEGVVLGASGFSIPPRNGLQFWTSRFWKWASSSASNGS
jgi:hypothetical protein